MLPSLHAIENGKKRTSDGAEKDGENVVPSLVDQMVREVARQFVEQATVEDLHRAVRPRLDELLEHVASLQGGKDLLIKALAVPTNTACDKVIQSYDTFQFNASHCEQAMVEPVTGLKFEWCKHWGPKMEVNFFGLPTEKRTHIRRVAEGLGLEVTSLDCWWVPAKAYRVHEHSLQCFRELGMPAEAVSCMQFFFATRLESLSVVH